MTAFTQFRPVDAASEIERAQTLAADVVQDPGNLRLDWIQKHEWTVVPVESSDHFSADDIRHLSAAFRQSGHYECLAVATEPLENTPVCYRLVTTEPALQDFNTAAWAFFFILIPEDRSWAVLCTKNDYYLVAGPVAFVTTALGVGIDQARAAFSAFAENNLHPTMREILRDINKHYESA